MRKFIFVLCLLSFGCDDSKKEEPKKSTSGLKLMGESKIDYDENAEVLVFRDEERKTTCYVVAGYGRGAINCLKDDLATQK